MKKWHILMIGLGSIGQRHVRNLKRLLGDQCEISAYRVRRLQQTFSDTMQIRDGVNLETEYHIKVYTDLKEALGLEQEQGKPDLVFITNITSKHMECALAAAEAGCHIFLEKPVSDNMDGVERLMQLKEEKKIRIFMGYQNRYHVCIKKLEEYLKEDILGQLVSVDAAFCERLTTMHTYEDYSTTYMARKEMGGGPILNLQIHDLDYLQWLFGMPESVYAAAGKHSSLKIDVEDHAVVSYVTDYRDNPLTVTSRTDFLQYPPVHTCRVVGEKGRIELDFNRAAVTLILEDGKPEVSEYPDFVRNDMFLQELQDCLHCIQEDAPEKIPLSEGIKGLKIALAAKESAARKALVTITSLF
ncbi:MAG: Gfo/Idh/MocA family oxidoreductase [Lachnospiraceae bacterium]|nr:Gfo/Idh/MocA family oxidoreductase [Lachnospiraceae bacterium]